VEFCSNEEDSIRRSRMVGRIWLEMTGSEISMRGRFGWARSRGTWKLETCGLSNGVIPPSFGRERPLFST
jgi:hypothetical protein